MTAETINTVGGRKNSVEKQTRETEDETGNMCTAYALVFCGHDSLCAYESTVCGVFLCNDF